ncbi:hypothetical protein SAMN04488688_101496 [Paenibacillus sp. cl141a]|uniref:hypothetical protein n=1 Tax=Paenibacillus sp. cl141a TaxID=1761877 RepID=UPI0008B1DED2|nr:hypothetical protein [Paenibacillus sp. cl141a]SEK33645.1 hypothetical protein SAMN04488688_101496 [Paenibacillus sp. cl141a]
MAFGISKQELQQWKQKVAKGDIAFLTHYWYDKRFPEFHTVTKVGCSDISRLKDWCISNGLNPQYIHHRQPYPHFDLIGPKQTELLQKYKLEDHITRFGLS